MRNNKSSLSGLIAQFTYAPRDVKKKMLFGIFLLLSSSSFFCRPSTIVSYLLAIVYTNSIHFLARSAVCSPQMSCSYLLFIKQRHSDARSSKCSMYFAIFSQGHIGGEGERGRGGEGERGRGGEGFL